MALGLCWASKHRLVVNPAFGLIPVTPAAGAGVFAGLDLGGAGLAADGGVAGGFERVAGEVARGEMRVEGGLVPIGERVDLQAALVKFKARQTGSPGLVALAAGNPRVERGQCTAQWFPPS